MGMNGVWGGDSENLSTFNRLYKAGSSTQEAAWSTFTGKMAGRIFKFDQVKFDRLQPDPNDPNPAEPRTHGFTSVHCTFYR
jgi:hypothetical protein